MRSSHDMCMFHSANMPVNDACKHMKLSDMQRVRGSYSLGGEVGILDLFHSSLLSPQTNVSVHCSRKNADNV